MRPTTRILVALSLLFAAIPLFAADPAAPGSWLARSFAEGAAPGVLAGPVAERWRVNAAQVIVRGDRALLCVADVPAAPAPPGAPGRPVAPSDLLAALQKAQQQAVYSLECRELPSGRSVWKRPLGRGCAFPPRMGVWAEDLVVVQVPCKAEADGQTPPLRLEVERWLLNTRTGDKVDQVPPRPLVTPQTRSLINLPRPGSTEWVLADRELLQKAFLDPGAASLSPLRGLANWSEDDHQLLDSAMALWCIPRHGAVPGLINRLVTPEGDVYWVDVLGGRLCKSRLATGDLLWSTPFIHAQPQGLAWRPPLLVAFSSRSSVTAYQCSDGRPVWTYEWPYLQADHYTCVLASLTDGLLLLTDPQIGRPVTMRNIGGGWTVDWNEHSHLTKLDPRGRVLFQQELPLLLGYGGMDVGDNAVLVWSGAGSGALGVSGPVVCLAPADPKGPPATQPQPDPGRVAELLAAYEAADPRQRLAICTDLARLGDTRIAERVVADLDAARSKAVSGGSPDLSQVQLQPAERAIIERENDPGSGYYVQALAILKDRRAIPKLLPLFDVRYLRSDVRQAIHSICDGEPMQDETYRTWRQQRLGELHDRHAALSVETQPAATPADQARARIRERLEQSRDGRRPSQILDHMRAMDERREAGRLTAHRAATIHQKIEIVTELADLDDPGVLDLVIQDMENLRATQVTSAGQSQAGATPDLRFGYLRGLANVRDKRLVPVLLPFLDEADPTLRHEASVALGHITGVQFVQKETLGPWWEAHRHLYESGPN